MQSASAKRARWATWASILFIPLLALMAPARAEPLKECGSPSADLMQGTLDVAGLNRILAGCAEFLREEPNNPFAYFNMGLAYDSGGDGDRAITYYTKAIELKPDFARAYNYRGNRYNRKDEFERAVADQTKAIAIDPNDFRNYWSRFDAQFNMGNHSAAIADISKAIELSPKEDYIMFYNRGGCYERLGNLEAAIADYRKAELLSSGSFPPVTNDLKRLGVQ